MRPADSESKVLSGQGKDKSRTSAHTCFSSFCTAGSKREWRNAPGDPTGGFMNTCCGCRDGYAQQQERGKRVCATDDQKMSSGLDCATVMAHLSHPPARGH